MRRSAGLAAALLVGAASAAAAQHVRVGLYGVGITYNEIREGREAEGGGGGASLSLRFGRFGLDASGFAARLDPENDDPDFDMLQGDVRVSYAFAPAVALEIGTGRRKIDPEFAAQDVGLVRVGFLSEMALNRQSAIWVRGAWLAGTEFSGGGSSDLAVEVGFGVGVGTPNGRFRGRADFEFQRIDREVTVLDVKQNVPLQMAVGRLGVEIGFW